MKEKSFVTKMTKEGFEAVKTKEKITREEADKAMRDEKMERAKLCAEKIQAILIEDKCQFDITMILKTGQVIPQVDIIAV